MVAFKVESTNQLIHVMPFGVFPQLFCLFDCFVLDNLTIPLISAGLEEF